MSFQAVTYLLKQWRCKVRAELVMAHQAQRIEDALCDKNTPHMAPAPIPFLPLVLHPRKGLWDGSEVHFVAPTDVVCVLGNGHPGPLIE